MVLLRIFCAKYYDKLIIAGVIFLFGLFIFVKYY